jgi:RNA polymerase sigma-70 factor, ECF subfamily
VLIDTIDNATSTTNEPALIRAAQRGNFSAFRQLLLQYDGDVLGLAFRITGSERRAQDLYEEALLKIYLNLKAYRRQDSFHTWIYRIVTNLCLGYLRSEQVHKTGFDLLLGDVRDRVNRALHTLTPLERIVFELKHHHQLKLRTVGEVLNTTEEVASNALVRATQKLRAVAG